MAIKIRVDLGQTDAEIADHILKIVAARLRLVLRLSTASIRLRLQDLCDRLIEDTDAYRSLLSGELLGELGIPDVENRLREVLSAVRRGVVVGAEPVLISGGKIKGGMSVGILGSDMEDVLGVPAGTYMSGVHRIPWLEWLVSSGERIMVFGYDVTFDIKDAARAASRTGLAIMIPRTGRGWRVPTEFSGTLGDNFLTRAFDGDGVAAEIASIMRGEIQGRLDRGS